MLESGEEGRLSSFFLSSSRPDCGVRSVQSSYSYNPHCCMWNAAGEAEHEGLGITMVFGILDVGISRDYMTSGSYSFGLV